MAPLFAALIGASVSLFVVALFRSNVTVALAHRRVAQMAPVDAPDPLSPSFSNRVLKPLTTKAADITTGVLPSRVLASVRHYLEMAGRPLEARSFMVIWLIAGGVMPAFIAMILIIGGRGIGGATLLAILIYAAAGMYLPWAWLRRKARARAQTIERSLPDAMDLIITNIEAGLGLQAALLAVSEKMEGPVGEEFGRAVRDISLGRDRGAVFDAMARRSGVAEMRLFARAVSQSEQTGTPIARVLRNHAADSRERRRQAARERAAKVPIKIMLPTALFIFPTLFIVILGPIGIYASQLGK